MPKAKPVIKAAALDKKIATATQSLTAACDDANKAVAKRTAEQKKLIAEIKRHLKKARTLTRKSKTASNKLKKDPSAANRKALADITKEITATRKAKLKAQTTKKSLQEELAALKASAKRLNTYTKAIAASDKVLNKPARKKRVKRKARA